MRKILALTLVIYAFASVAAGQGTSDNDEIPESQYILAEKYAVEQLRIANHRSVWVSDRIKSSSPKDIHIFQRQTKEFIRPNKARLLEETLGKESSRFELIWIGDELYSRFDDKPWVNKLLSSTTIISSDHGEEFGKRHSFASSVRIDGNQADLYELKFKTLRFVEDKNEKVIFLTTIRIWYLKNGNFLRKSREDVREGSDWTYRETTTYEYGLKDLTIEAPIK